jgi:hypothetical protein
MKIKTVVNIRQKVHLALNYLAHFGMGCNFQHALFIDV